MADEVLLKIRADIKDLKTSVKKIESEFAGSGKKIQGSADKMSGSFKAMGNVLKAALSIAVLYKFKQGLMESAKAASNLEEQTAKFGTVFRGSVAEANKSVRELTDNFAMSEREAKEFMAGVQDMLVPMGMARDRAAGFSSNITKLAADLGSFNNIPTADAMNKIKSALVGMYRPMREVGVVLTAATVEQRALKDGLAATAEELTAADKAITAYRMSVEMSADAVGDMARTHDSYANTIKRFNAQMEDFKASVGKYVIPALAFWADKLAIVIDGMDRLIGMTEKEPPRTMLEAIKGQIVDLRVEQMKYQEALESGYYWGQAELNLKEKIRISKESELNLQKKVNRLIKEGKDIDYLAAAKEAAEAERKAALEAEKKAKAEKAAAEAAEAYNDALQERMGWEVEHKEFKPIIDTAGVEGTGEVAKSVKKKIDDAEEGQKNLNKSFTDGIQAVYDWGHAIDVVFSRAENKGEQVKNLLFSIVGGSIGFAVGGPTGAGYGAQIGGQIGQLTSSTSTSRRSAELTAQASNLRSYTAYKVGAY